MFSISDFVLKFSAYSDEELSAIVQNAENYSKEAVEAAGIVIAQKGGSDALYRRIEEKQKLQKEISRIEKETKEMGSKGIDASFIKTVTNSSVLTDEKVKEIIDTQYLKVEADLNNKKINPRTIVGSITGGAIASVIGGTLWGLQMIYSSRVFYIFLIGLVLLCYGIIKFTTKQDKNNTVVFLATIISTVLAVLIGFLLYSVFGYIE